MNRRERYNAGPQDQDRPGVFVDDRLSRCSSRGSGRLTTDTRKRGSAERTLDRIVDVDTIIWTDASEASATPQVEVRLA